MDIIKKSIPGFIKDFLKKKIVGSKQNDKTYYCPVCNHNVNEFNRLSDVFFEEWNENQFIQSIFCVETFNFLSYCCKICGATDRDRLYAIFLKEILLKVDKIKVIDFAPSAVSRLINNSNKVEYISADLFVKNVDVNIDIQNINIYNDNYFDAFICSHILEHVGDDVKALSELYRILKPGGWGILMVPIFLNLNEDYENSSIVSESDRWKHFGQSDHVRIYSKKGFVKKVQNAGFLLKQLDVNYFGKNTFAKCKINQRSVLYIAEKATG